MPTKSQPKKPAPKKPDKLAEAGQRAMTKTIVAIAKEKPIIESFNGIFTQSQIDLVKRTICKGATDDELSLFLAVCQRTGLDPFARQIYSIARRAKNDAGEWVETRSIQTGIDGFRVIAEKTNEVDGQEGPFWCGPDGEWKEMWLDNNLPPVAAKVIVHRKGMKHPFVGVARFDAYAQFYKADGGWKLTQMWNRMGDVMIAKCAEALALRKAFPQKLGELRTTDEMMQAENPERPEPEKLPAGATVEVFPPEKETKATPVVASDKPAWSTFVCAIGAANGPFLGKTLAEIKPKALLALSKDPRIGNQKGLAEMVALALAARASEMPQEATEPEKGKDTAPKEEKPAGGAPASKAKPSEDDAPKEKLPAKPMAWRSVVLEIPPARTLCGKTLGEIADAKLGDFGQPDGYGKAWLRTCYNNGIKWLDEQKSPTPAQKVLRNAIIAAHDEVKPFDDPEWWNAIKEDALARELNRRIAALAMTDAEVAEALDEPIFKGTPIDKLGKDLLLFTLGAWGKIEEAVIQTREAK